MKFESTPLPGVIRIVPTIHRDARGYFIECWQSEKFAGAGISTRFLQENFSLSAKGTLRGIHYQLQPAQGRLVRVVEGAVFDVAVDLRKSSPTFGHWTGEIL
jgi:dTDP-4-dehydrorhamnose 3,5-epimerase